MTLFKQVAIVVSLVFFLVVVTILVAGTRQYSSIVRGQLNTTAQDIVTTLGITISNSAFGNDQPAYETLFNAVFDSGYYSSIRLVAPDGELIHKKERKLEIEDVPDWFIKLVPIDAATASTEVMQGWTPLGTLHLTLHPGYVYYGLYANLKTTLLWFVLLFSLGMLSIWLTLHQMLRPLIRVREQADAIHNNQFVKQSSLPHTVELRSVVNAMNRMVDKVHAVFDEQEETLASYQKLLFEDPLTGLGNRKYFLSHLENAHSEEAAFHSHLVVIKVVNLEHVRESYGYDKADKAVIALADIIRAVSAQLDECHCARLAADDFALLAPVDEETLVEFSDDIFEQFKAHGSIIVMRDDVSLASGISAVHLGREMGETLANTDFALTQAQSAGPYTTRVASTAGLALPQGKIQWRNWLEKCIDDGRFFLVRQKVMNAAGEAIHQEVFVRLRNEDNEIVPAGMFMPMANSLNMGEAIDRVVFQLVKGLCGKSNEIPVALNLTASVFSHADALVEFNQMLAYFQQSSTGLCVEASHTILEQFPAMCAEVAESVRQAGHVFGIDNLNLSRSLHQLKTVRPDYLKVNAQSLYDITQGDMPAGYQALRTMINAMDIQLIAVAVDSAEIRDHLQKLGIDSMQGNLLSEAEEFL